MTAPLVVSHLKKFYGGNQSANDLSFEVNSGEIFGLIGPDGSGKTIILRILVTLLKPDSGSVLFLGKDIQHNMAFVRENVGYMPERFSLYRDLTVEQNLRFFGDLFAVPKDIQDQRIERLYTFSHLKPFAKRQAGDLSGGMKQKLALSCMLMHEPKVLVMDEPTTGVDPVSRAEFWQILHELAAQGTAIVVSTAYMDEAAQCDRMALIYDGVFLALDTPEALVKNFNYRVYRLTTAEPAYQAFEKLQTTSYKNSIQLFGSGIHLMDKQQEGEALVQKINSLGVKVEALLPLKPQLEDVFLDLMSNRKQE